MRNAKRQMTYWGKRLLLVLAAGQLLGLVSCGRQFQRELEVLFAVESSPQFIASSVLVELLGFEVLGLFN